MRNALHSKASVQHYTPLSVIERVRATLQTIDLDPASCALANADVRAKQFYDGSPGSNGLVLPWFGNVFVNPPGKSKENPGGQAAWWAKLMHEWSPSDLFHPLLNAVFLGFSLELLQTAQRYACPQPTNFLYCVPRRRIAFDRLVDGKRVPGKSPTHGNIIVCVWEDSAVPIRFRRHFKDLGLVNEGSMV